MMFIISLIFAHFSYVAYGSGLKSTTDDMQNFLRSTKFQPLLDQLKDILSDTGSKVFVASTLKSLDSLKLVIKDIIDSGNLKALPGGQVTYVKSNPSIRGDISSSTWEDAPLARGKYTSSSSGYMPVIQMHGMGDFAKDPFGMVPLADAISEYLNGTYVLNVQIGKNSIADILNGFFMNLDDQVEYFHQVVSSDPQLSYGFNAVGYSQGNLVIRGYIERFNDPPVLNFISMHGPLAGVAAFPGCSLDNIACKLLTEVLGALAYHPKVQNNLAQANYFRDPLNIPVYEEGAIFLPDVNNEDSSLDQKYSSRFASLSSLCLVKALADTVVIPNESEWFGFYEDGSLELIWTFDETPWYSQDSFGLKQLAESGKVFFNTTDGNHLDFSTDFLLSLVGEHFMTPVSDTIAEKKRFISLN